MVIIDILPEIQYDHMPYLQQPDSRELEKILLLSKQDSYSYSEVGASRDNKKLKGFDNDHNRALLGKGKSVYRAASQAIQAWKMMPPAWTSVFPAEAEIKPEREVILIIRIFGLFWLNTSRIAYILEEVTPVRRSGFAYGTLGRHIESGEELFSVEWRDDDTVWYVVKAFSRPKTWYAKIAYPLVRYFQKRFVEDSKMHLKNAVTEILSGTTTKVK